jgi:hypothetical protein
LNSKFFGNPNGPKPPAKQTKLAFSSKSGNNGTPSSSAPKEEDVDMKDTKLEEEDESKVEETEVIDSKEDVEATKGTTISRLIQLLLNFCRDEEAVEISVSKG